MLDNIDIILSCIDIVLCLVDMGLIVYFFFYRLEKQKRFRSRILRKFNHEQAICVRSVVSRTSRLRRFHP